MNYKVSKSTFLSLAKNFSQQIDVDFKLGFDWRIILVFIDRIFDLLHNVKQKLFPVFQSFTFDALV